MMDETILPSSDGMSIPKTVLVTGAARRIGRAIACDLGAWGWSVVVHYNRSAEEAEAYFDDGVNCILDSGPSSVQVPSTVVVIEGGTLNVVREGVITAEELEACWNG